MIDRISIVSRLTQALYPEGVPADRVAHLPHHLALLDVVAESVATGKAPSVPLALMAGDPCPYEPVGGSELDPPIPYVPVVPVFVPPTTTTPVKPAKAGAEVEPTKRPGRKSQVDWDKEDRLGKMSDAALARELGVTANSVRLARVARNIPFSPEVNATRRGPKGIDWDKEDRLGKVPDHVIADELGVVPSAVHQARQARGIPASVPPHTDGARVPSAQAGIKWNEETRLGKIPDAELARALGVTPGAVHQARYVRGIPSATPKPKAPAEPAVTPERQAEIDKINAAIREGKVKRITPEEAKADLEAKYRQEPTRYGRGRPPAKKGSEVQA